MYKSLKRLLIATLLFVFIGSGFAPFILSAPEAAAASEQYSLVTKSGKPLSDGDLRRLNDVIQKSSDSNHTGGSAAYFDNFLILAKGGVWEKGTFLDWKDVNDPQGQDFYTRYAGSYYCVDDKPLKKDNEAKKSVNGKYGTYRVGVSVSLPFGNRESYDIKDHDNIKAILHYTEVEYLPNSVGLDATEDKSHMWRQYGWSIEKRGDVSDGGKDNNFNPKNDVRGNATLVTRGGDDHDSDFTLKGSNLQLLTKSGDDLLGGGCDVASDTGIYKGRVRNAENVDKTIKNFLVKDLDKDSGWKEAFDSAKKQTGTGEDGSGAGGTIDVPECQKQGALTWIICPVIEGLGNLADKLKNVLAQQLSFGSTTSSTEPGGVFCSNEPGAAEGSGQRTCETYKQAWGNVRNIALGLLVLAGLVVLISQGIGAEILSAYTIKKVLPRLLIAVIAMTLSWELLRFLVTFVNDLGAGVGALMEAPFADIDGEDFGEATGGFTQALVVGGSFYTVIGVFGVLTLITVAALSFFAAFIVIILRNILLTVLVILAPIAIVAYILPNTEKYYKLWWQNLTKALLMFPIIMAMISAGAIFSRVASSSENDINQVIAVIAYFAPYLMLPFAFKMAGGLMSLAGNIMQNKVIAPAAGKSREYDGKLRKRTVARAKGGAFVPGTNKLSRGISKTAAFGANLGTGNIRGAMNPGAAFRAGATNFGMESLKNDSVVQANQGNDAFWLALANRKLAETKLAEAEESGDHNRVAIYKSALANASMVKNNSTVGVRAAALNELAKTGYQLSSGVAGYQELRDTITDIHGDEATNSAAHAEAMSTAQYHLKGAGRADLAGIDYSGPGPVRDKIKSGVRKLGSYGRGQGKPATYQGAAQGWLGEGAIGSNGKTLDTPDLAKHLDTALTSGEVSHKDVEEYHKMLLDDLPSATRANQVEIEKQLAGIEAYRDSRIGATPEKRAAVLNTQYDVNDPAAQRAVADQELAEKMVEHDRYRTRGGIPLDELNRQ